MTRHTRNVRLLLRHESSNLDTREGLLFALLLLVVAMDRPIWR